MKHFSLTTKEGKEEFYRYYLERILDAHEHIPLPYKVNIKKWNKYEKAMKLITEISNADVDVDELTEPYDIHKVIIKWSVDNIGNVETQQTELISEIISCFDTLIYADEEGSLWLLMSEIYVSSEAK